MTSTIDAPTDASPAPRRGRGIGKIAIIAGCLIITSMWAYYFLFASDKGVYQIEDASWRVAAKEICAAASAEREALANTQGGAITNPTLEQMQERARLVYASTDILEQMLNDIVAIPVDNDDDRTRLEFFAENYRILLSDRRRYAAELEQGIDEPYNETVVGGGPVTNVLTDFTAGVKGNDVPECSPPGELGDLQA
jgi:hypothetical protein